MDTIIRFIKRFIFDLYHALLFAAQGYDIRLRETKTTTQRVLIWLVIGAIAIVLFFLAIYGIFRFLESIEVSGLV